MAVVLCVANHKGGVGKTSLCVSLAWEFARKKRVLLIDTDPQGNASTHMGLTKNKAHLTIKDEFLKHDVYSEVVLSSNISVIPADATLYQFLTINPLDLECIIHKYSKKFDYIFIDCAPSMSNLTVGSFCVADYLLIPIQPNFLALEGLSDLLSTIQHVKREYRAKIEVLSIVVNMFDARQKIAKDICFYLKKHYKKLVAQTTIPQNVKVAEAPLHGLTVQQYDPTSPSAAAFYYLAKELMKKIEKTSQIQAVEKVVV